MKVRVDALRSGQWFRCASGRVWKYVRQDGASGKACIHVLDEQGRPNCFAGCAEVTPIFKT